MLESCALTLGGMLRNIPAPAAMDIAAGLVARRRELWWRTCQGRRDLRVNRARKLSVPVTEALKMFRKLSRARRLWSRLKGRTRPACRISVLEHVKKGQV
jgi:hypothetical protein